MANVFTNAKGVSSIAGVAIYTVPNNTTGVIIGLTLSNTTNQGVNVTATLESTSIITNVPIPAGASLSVLDGKIIATAGEVITVSSTTESSVDVIISLLEQS